MTNGILQSLLNGSSPTESKAKVSFKDHDEQHFDVETVEIDEPMSALFRVTLRVSSIS